MKFKTKLMALPIALIQTRAQHQLSSIRYKYVHILYL